MRMLLLLLVVTACAEPARSADPVRAPDRTTTSNDPERPADAAGPATPADAAAPDAAPTVVTSCPAGFGGFADGTPCAQRLQCPFAEGTCTCASGSYCGGAAPPPAVEAEYRKLRWTCTPKPPAVRPDGCPGIEPRGDNVRCATAGQTCTYGDCCSIPYRCTKGRWIGGQMSCPP